MGTSTDPAATVHPGAVRAIFDHLILALTVDGQPGAPVFLFSHYRFRWADDDVVGELAFVEVERDGSMQRLILTDRPALAGIHASRLSPRTWPTVDAERPATIATFETSSLVGQVVSEAVTSEGLTIDVEWSRLAAPILASGPAPRLPTEDIVSVLVEAAAARANANGKAVPGRPFANDAWVPWLGRPLSSAVVAIGEVLLTRP
jgi:hypothetical protein